LLAERRLVDEDVVGTDDVIVLKAARERQEELQVHAIAIEELTQTDDKDSEE